MNRRQKLVQKQFLNNEKTVIDRLQYIYDGALSDINKKIRTLEFQIGDLTEEYDWMDDDDPKKEIVRSKIQSKIYQKQYQEQLQKQVDGILKEMQTKQYLTIADYLDGCYEDGFVGSLFDLHGQDVPLLMPLDQTKMVRAVQLDSKISKGLYSRLGEDVTTLKKRITAEVTRSIATGASYAQCAQRLAGQTKIGYNKAIRIARTEGHRIQTTAAMDTMEGAKERGADVVKQWDSTLDGLTRESHVAVDGEIREVDEPFSNGLMFPGDPDGDAGEVVNCRCALLQRARWALGDGFSKWDNFAGKLEEFDRPEDYGEFKKSFFSDENRKYMSFVQRMEKQYGTKDFRKLLGLMTDREYKKYSRLLANNPVYNVKAPVASMFTPERVRWALNRKEAYDILKNDIGFADVSKSLDYIDEETIVAQTNQLSKLNQKFGAIGDNFGGYIGAENNKNFVACTRGSFKSANSQSLVYSFDDYAHGKDYLIKRAKDSIESGWGMPCLESEYLVYTTTHEYGHILQNKIMSERIDMDEFWKKYRVAVGSASSSGIKKGEKLLRKTSDECAKSIFMEILDIAKQNNSNFSLKENISDYGKTCYQEAFAEVFANSQLGKPNELGNAMNIWLERKGY